MSFDYSKLKGRIVEKYGTQIAFSKALGVSERSISLKLNGKVYFAQDEIDKILKLLGIEYSAIKDYFFTEKVQ